METDESARLLIDNATFTTLFIAVRARRTTVDIEIYRRRPRRIRAVEIRNGTQDEIVLDERSREVLRKHGNECLHIWDNTARFRFKWIGDVNGADGAIFMRLTPEVFKGNPPAIVYTELHLLNHTFGDMYVAIRAKRDKVEMMLYGRQPAAIETFVVPQGAPSVFELSGKPQENLTKKGSRCLIVTLHHGLDRIDWVHANGKYGMIVVIFTPEVTGREPTP